MTLNSSRVRGLIWCFAPAFTSLRMASLSMNTASFIRLCLLAASGWKNGWRVWVVVAGTYDSFQESRVITVIVKKKFHMPKVGMEGRGIPYCTMLF